MSGLTDRFGGSDAWDIYCADFDALIAKAKRDGLGCKTCKHSIICPVCGSTYCIEGEEWEDDLNPSCGYEGYEGASDV